MAIPTCAHQGHVPIWGHQPCYNYRLHVRPMVFGIAVGEANGSLIARGDIVAAEGKAGRVEMLEALLHAVLGTDSQSHLATQQITPLGMDCIEPPAQLKAI